MLSLAVELLDPHHLLKTVSEFVIMKCYKMITSSCTCCVVRDDLYLCREGGLVLVVS